MERADIFLSISPKGLCSVKCWMYIPPCYSEELCKCTGIPTVGEHTRCNAPCSFEAQGISLKFMQGCTLYILNLLDYFIFASCVFIMNRSVVSSFLDQIDRVKKKSREHKWVQKHFLGILTLTSCIPA